MGLGFNESDAHWSYSGFMQFRRRLAREIGICLDLMQGFRETNREVDCQKDFYWLPKEPLKWENIKDPIAEFLSHSDCDGQLGVIMRMAPIPMAYYDNPAKCRDYCKLNAKMTHPSPQAIGSSIYMGWIISNLIQGLSKSSVLDGPFSDEWAYLQTDPEMTSPELWGIINQEYKSKKQGISGGIIGSGYVISCLESALWAFDKTDNFKDGVLEAVNLGNDADTTGAVYGQIAGAHYGLSGIPKEWLDKLYDFKTIKIKAEEIYKLTIKNK